MNKRKYRLTITAHLILILIFVLGLVGAIYSQGFVFGSTTDWINQHSIFPEYFRQYFYETGHLIPKFNMNMGAGQNTYNIAYHGLLNPVVLLSYLFPFIKMIDYIKISSIAIVIISTYLVYFWMLKNKKRQDVSFICSILFVCSGPLIFHSHKQIVFIQYMPFIIMALMGVDRFFKRKRYELLIISILLIILTNYYFSVGAIIAVTIYGIYRFLEEKATRCEKIKLKEFISCGLKFAGCIITAVLMSGILILPTFMAILGGRDKNPESMGGMDWSYLIPDLDVTVICYSAYGLGLTAIAIISLIAIIKTKNYPKVFLGIVLGLIVIFPVVRYVLNAGLYIRAKSLIPFLPLYILPVAAFVEDLLRNRVKFKTYAITVTIVFLLFLVSNGFSIQMLIFTLDLGVTLTVIYFSRKWKKPWILFIPVIFISLVSCIIMNMQDSYVTKEYAANLDSSDRRELITNVLENDDSFYRMNNLNYSEYTSNMYFGTGYYQTSMYSSVYNKYYNDLIHDTLQLANPTINGISSVNAPNIIFSTFMGIKYIDSQNIIVPIGYEKVMTVGEYSMYRNDNVYSLGFSTNKIMSEETFLELAPIDRQNALLEYIVTKAANNVEYESLYNQLDVSIDFLEELKKDGLYHINLDEGKKIKVDLSEYDYDIYAVNIKFDKVRNKNIFIYINGTRNALSGKYAAFPNNNLYFSYILSSNEELKHLDVTFGKGEYVITEYEIYGMKYKDVENFRSNMDMMENIVIDDDKIKGDICVSNDGYLNFTIPYDEGFTLFVDGKETKIEMTDTSFMGCVISSGSHTIELVYEAPGFKLGSILSIIGSLIFLGIICYDLIFFLNHREKKCN